MQTQPAFKYLIKKSAALLACVLCISTMALDKAPAEYPYYDVQVATKDNGIKNTMTIVDSGIAALQIRIDMIRRAKKRISMEYFIYEQDRSGKIIFSELIKRAEEGLDVRILLDKSITIIEMDEFFAEAVAKHGIKLWHYNRALDPSTAQFRTHRKILVIDGKEVLTGGRNIGDDYFDLDEEYNFLDRDVHIEGPIAKTFQDSFDAYWDYRPTTKPSRVLKPSHTNRLFRGNRRNGQRYAEHRGEVMTRKRTEAAEWLADMEGIDELKAKVEKVARPILNKSKSYECPVTTFVSDKPGARLANRFSRDFRKNYKIISEVIFDKLYNEVKGELLLASPYFILNDRWEKLLDHLLVDRKIPVQIYTNSLGSTDAFYVAAAFYRTVFDLQKKGLVPWIHNSRFAGFNDTYDESVKKVRWGMHSKSHVYDEDSIYIGTYNIDNRSDFYNAEMGIFCDGSKELADDLRNKIQKRMNVGYQITGELKAEDKDGHPADVYGNATAKQVKIMKAFTIPSLIFEDLL